MPKAQLITTNFTAGVFSPLRGRVDGEVFQQHARRLETWCASNRAASRLGHRWIFKPIRDEAAQARLIPFVYSNTTSYTLEFGALFIRFRKTARCWRHRPARPTSWSRRSRWLSWTRWTTQAGDPDPCASGASADPYPPLR